MAAFDVLKENSMVVELYRFKTVTSRRIYEGPRVAHGNTTAYCQSRQACHPVEIRSKHSRQRSELCSNHNYSIYTKVIRTLKKPYCRAISALKKYIWCDRLKGLWSMSYMRSSMLSLEALLRAPGDGSLASLIAGTLPTTKSGRNERTSSSHHNRAYTPTFITS